MRKSLKHITSMILLLLSWAFFVSPAVSSVMAPSDEQHQRLSNISLCDGESCTMHTQSAQSCAEHCESLSFITTHWIKNETSTNASFPLVLDDSQIFYQYLRVELKPPIQL